MIIQNFLIPLQKEIGDTIHFSGTKALEPEKLKELQLILGNLYPYHVKNDDLPLNAWAYLFNSENIKQPIFWPNNIPDNKSLVYFKQFIDLINRVGVIGRFRNIQKPNGKTEPYATKLMTILPTREIPERTREE